MLVNEAARNSPEAQNRSFHKAMAGLQEHTEFPLTDLKGLQEMTGEYGQRPTYRALAATYGLEAARVGLSNILPPQVVDMQLSVLVGPEQS